MTATVHPTRSVVTAMPVWSRLRALWAPAATVAVVAAGCTVVALANPTDPDNVLPTCPTKLLFGVTCPGCGSLRMAYSLMHRDLGAAAHYNALTLVMLPLFVLGWVTWTMSRWRGYTVRSWQHWRWTPAVFTAVYAVWFVIRNIPVEPFRSLRV